MAGAKAQSKKAPPKKPIDFDAVFARLRSILVPYAKRLAVKEGTSAYYYLETKTAVYKGKPGFFAAVRNREELCQLSSDGAVRVSGNAQERLARATPADARESVLQFHADRR
jgi:hypothetical protein